MASPLDLKMVSSPARVRPGGMGRERRGGGGRVSAGAADVGIQLCQRQEDRVLMHAKIPLCKTRGPGARAATGQRNNFNADPALSREVVGEARNTI